LIDIINKIGLTWYIYYFDLNGNGTAVIGAQVIGVVTITLKQTLIRVLILIISLGYGVTKYTYII